MKRGFLVFLVLSAVFVPLLLSCADAGSSTYTHELKSVIESGKVPSDLSAYGSLVQTVLEPYAANAAIVARYVSSKGNGNASSSENAAGDIKATMDSITDVGANKIYLVLLASGIYTPTATLAMKNHVAIVGGWNEWEHTGTSTISGDNARGVFRNSGIDQTALLYGVTIANGNSSTDGGGMYNRYSSPTLSHVTFSGNTAYSGGGGMYNWYSSPTLSHVTFTDNTAAEDGGGMYNDNDVGSGPTIVNSLFWNNKGGATQKTVGQQIYMHNASTAGGAEKMTIAFSLVQHGIKATSGVTSDNNANDGLGIGGGTDSVTVTQDNIIINDPKLAANLADNGGFVKTIALLENSAAINKGVYVRRSGTVGSFTFYYSEDSTNWFTDLTLSSSTTLHGNAIDLTATDARGYTRTGRPDIGAYEYGGTAL